MKRSEMIDLIYNELMPIGLVFGSEEDEYLKYKAEDLLDQLEKAGMLPPETLIETDNPLVPGDFNIKGKWYTPGKFVWEDEAKPSISDIIKQVLEDNKEVLEKIDE